MNAYATTELAISLDAIESNYHALRRVLNGRAKIIAVVKANAYGHGMIPVAERLATAGADMLAVANLDEAVALRDAGIAAPVLVVGALNPSGAREAVERSIEHAIWDTESLDALESAARAACKPALAHLKIDTGMNRLGVKGDAALAHLLGAWANRPNVQMKGIFTHFAAVDDDLAFTCAQNELFRGAIIAARRAGHSPEAHAAASAAIARGGELWYDYVRPGIALYGGSVCDVIEGLIPAQRLTTRPTRLQWIAAGETVGYGREFTTARDTLVMTLPVGYGDGYKRVLGGQAGRARVLIRGTRAPVIGRVCMDQIMADVTRVPGASMGDEVTLLGKQGNDRITPDEMARWADTIPYEVMLGFGQREIKKVCQ